MYKYRVNFRYRTAQNSSSGFTPGNLEFTFPSYIERDGPGEWKNKVKNIIQTQTAISASSILDDAFELSNLGQIQENKSTNNTSSNISDEEKDSIFNATVAANRERREAKEQELERKAIQEERQRKLDLEEAKFRAEQEAKEAAARKQRADQLRREGKNFQAFLVEFQNGIIAVVSVLFLVGLGAYFMIDGENQKQNAVQINADLEKIEDSVRIYINEKNFDLSLVLANQLNHPLHEVYKGKGTMWESEYYDLYWNKKREEYKEIILNKGTLTEDKSEENKESSKSNKKKSSEKEEEVNETSDVINTDEEKSASDEELDPEYQ